MGASATSGGGATTAAVTAAAGSSFALFLVVFAFLVRGARGLGEADANTVYAPARIAGKERKYECTRNKGGQRLIELP
jgi:hypothetical protein